MGSITKVITFKEYVVNEDKKLYNQFMADMKELEKNGKAHIGVSSGYEVKTDNDIIFSVKRYVLTVDSNDNSYVTHLMQV